MWQKIMGIYRWCVKYLFNFCTFLFELIGFIATFLLFLTIEPHIADSAYWLGVTMHWGLVFGIFCNALNMVIALIKAIIQIRRDRATPH